MTEFNSLKFIFSSRSVGPHGRTLDAYQLSRDGEMIHNIVKKCKLLANVTPDFTRNYHCFKSKNLSPILGSNFNEPKKKIKILRDFYPNKLTEEYAKSLKYTEKRKFLQGIIKTIFHVHQLDNESVGNLKPNNIMINEKNEPVLVDYMLPSWVICDNNKFNRYKAKHPECRQASDIYSFGLIVYLILTGHEPFSEELEDTNNLDPSCLDFSGLRQEDEYLIKICCDEDPERRPTIQDLLSYYNISQEFDTGPPPKPKPGLTGGKIAPHANSAQLPQVGSKEAKDRFVQRSFPMNPLNAQVKPVIFSRPMSIMPDKPKVVQTLNVERPNTKSAISIQKPGQQPQSTSIIFQKPAPQPIILEKPPISRKDKLLEEAEQKRRDGDRKAAIELLKVIEPGDGNVLSILGACYKEEGQLDEAFSCFIKWPTPDNLKRAEIIAELKGDVQMFQCLMNLGLKEAALMYAISIKGTKESESRSIFEAYIDDDVAKYHLATMEKYDLEKRKKLLQGIWQEKK